ncbi:hypothetical protein E2C01_097175 [Portunus trituberculatus]|uniref:Uncharacterized protein n=1 Tax=Portunus trituberculatus TaxID=210409 RepID=A0A5B7K9A1_PORTR|nr:hypothetical protein [Portunus trituberculatus]
MCHTPGISATIASLMKSSRTLWFPTSAVLSPASACLFCADKSSPSLCIRKNWRRNCSK